MKPILAALLACLGLTAFGQPTNVEPGTTERDGQALAARLRSLQPAEGVTNTAMLRIRAKANTTEVPLRIEVSITESNWATRYLALDTNQQFAATFSIVQHAGARPIYQASANGLIETTISNEQLFAAFANSDFWLADLGMEFLHWPTQRLLKKEIRRGQSCDKLESIAPPGHTNGYVRVVSWFDIDTGGPVICEAYDAKGKMVKEFKPNDFTKVDGQWRVEELEMRDLRTGSRSFIRFHLKD